MRWDGSKSVTIRLTGTDAPGIRAATGFYGSTEITILDRILCDFGDMTVYPPSIFTLPVVGGIDTPSIQFMDFVAHRDPTSGLGFGGPWGISFDGTVGVFANSLKLLPTQSTITAVGLDVGGTITLKSNSIEAFSIQAGMLRGQVKDWFSLETTGLQITPMADTIVRMDTLSAGIPRLDVYGSLTDFAITRDGLVSVSGFQASSVHGVFHSLGLASLLPADLTGLGVEFHKNQNGDYDLGSFDIRVTGRMNQEFFKAWPFKPVVRIGEQDLNIAGDEFTFVLDVSRDGIFPKEIAPIELGFTDLKLGPVTLGGTITLGGYTDGQFNPDFGGWLRIDSGLDDLRGSAEVRVTGRGLDGAWEAIENLNGFSVGINDVKIGPVKIGGALSLGMVQVDTNGDGQDERAFYARLKGSFGYSNIGGGIDIAFSQYGPIMATLSIGGIVIPAVGFSFGIENAGFNFGGQPFPSVTDPTELLTNPVFHSPTAITLGEIERRVKNAMIAGVPTWYDGFTLTGTATVSNIYVGGLIKGNVTLAANLACSSTRWSRIPAAWAMQR